MMCGPALWGLGRLRDVYPIYRSLPHALPSWLMRDGRRTTGRGPTDVHTVQRTPTPVPAVPGAYRLMVTRSLKRRNGTASMRARTRIRADMINTTSSSPDDRYTRVGRDTDRAVKYTVESVACSNTTVAEPRAGILSRLALQYRRRRSIDAHVDAHGDMFKAPGLTGT
jgi:hypothetical protein